MNKFIEFNIIWKIIIIYNNIIFIIFFIIIKFNNNLFNLILLNSINAD